MATHATLLPKPGVCFLQTLTQPGHGGGHRARLFVCPADVLPQAWKYPPSFPRLERRRLSLGIEPSSLPLPLTNVVLSQSMSVRGGPSAFLG